MQGVRIIDNVVEVEVGVDTAVHAAGDVLFQPIELPLITNDNGCAVITSIVVTDYDDQGIAINLGWFYVVLSYFVIVGTSNAVNLTDGLDGLAILPTVLIAGALAVFAYATGNVKFSVYLGIPYIRDAAEIVVFCGALVGRSTFWSADSCSTGMVPAGAVAWSIFSTWQCSGLGLCSFIGRENFHNLS